MSTRRLKRANPKTIHDKFIVGYQGWFTCAGDGEPVGPGHHGWLHWFNYPIPDGGRPNTDLWPDVSAYSPSELYPAPGLAFQDGSQAFLFSSRHPKTVQRHFRWMAEHGIDGAFLQRFAGQCDLEAGNEGIRRIRDEVGDVVMKAAEQEGRVYAIMYDVSGVPPDRIQRVLEDDWGHLVRDQGVLDSPSYLREKGQPVLTLWGFGFEDSRHTPRLVHDVIESLRRLTPGGLYIVAGTPAYWRTADNDADRDAGFLKVWLNEVDAISPWTVGRYNTEEEVERFAEQRMKGDVDLLKQQAANGGRKVDYLPVVLPGGSGCNLSEGKWKFNDIKRNGGRFLWKQIFHAKRLGVRAMYGAMWDEYDEGTALMPCVTKKANLPQSRKHDFLALDEDGYDIPADWYMRICGFAAEGLRSERRIHETFPSKELDDYWSTRPKYEAIEDRGEGGSGGGGGGVGDEYQVWLATQKEDKDEPPPPPYCLEAAAEAAPHSQVLLQPQGQPSTSTATAPMRTSTPPQLEAPLESIVVHTHSSPGHGVPSGSGGILNHSPTMNSFGAGPSAVTHPTSLGSFGAGPSTIPSASLFGAGPSTVPQHTMNHMTDSFSRQDISGSMHNIPSVRPPPVPQQSRPLSPPQTARPVFPPPPVHPNTIAYSTSSSSSSFPPSTPTAGYRIPPPPPMHPAIGQRPSAPNLNVNAGTRPSQPAASGTPSRPPSSHSRPPSRPSSSHSTGAPPPVMNANRPTVGHRPPPASPGFSPHQYSHPPSPSFPQSPHYGRPPTQASPVASSFPSHPPQSPGFAQHLTMPSRPHGAQAPSSPHQGYAPHPQMPGSNYTPSPQWPPQEWGAPAPPPQPSYPGPGYQLPSPSLPPPSHSSSYGPFDGGGGMPQPGPGSRPFPSPGVGVGDIFPSRAGGGGGYNPSYAQPEYPPQQPQGYFPPGQSNYPGQHDSGGSYSGAQTSCGPQPSQDAGGFYNPSAGPGRGAPSFMNQASDMFGNVVSKKTRDQLWQGGSKVMSKFSR